MPRSKSNKQKPIKQRKITITRRPVLIVVIILAIAAVTLIVMKLINDNAASNNQSDATTSESATQTEPLGTSDGSTSDDLDYNNPQTPTQYEGPNANTYDNLTGAITYAEAEGDYLYIGTNIDQFLSSGTCALTLTNGAKTVTQTADIIANPTTSACDGFTIPTSELSSGSWEITIDLNSNNKTGTLNGKVTI